MQHLGPYPGPVTGKSQEAVCTYREARISVSHSSPANSHLPQIGSSAALLSLGLVR